MFPRQRGPQRVSVGDEPGLLRAFAALALAADQVGAGRDPGTAVLGVDQVRGAGGGQDAEGEPGGIVDAGGPLAGAGISDQGVRVSPCRAAEQFDSRARDLVPPRVRRGGVAVALDRAVDDEQDARRGT